MKTDDQVLEDAIPIIENQWCKGVWHMTPDRSEDEGLSRDHHYCAIGAVQKAAQTRVQFETTGLRTLHVSARKIAQVKRIADRLATTISEQYPDWGQVDDSCAFVENYNDFSDREAMLVIFQKTLLR